MNRELLATLETIEKEKNITKEALFEALRTALISACRKTHLKNRNIDVQINPETAEVELYEDGKQIHDTEFGRIAAQTAKQIIIQKIREAEREFIFGHFSQKVGDIATGTVHRIDKKMIIVDFGKTEGILPAREQSPNDAFRQGDTIKVFLQEVKRTDRGPEVIVSRSSAELVRKLFQLEVPEIHDGIVEIKGVAREAGSRTKIAVFSKESKIDCVGSCVGMRGQRVKNIVRELGGEKIDIVRWSEDAAEFIRNALAPAELADIRLRKSEKSAEIFVADAQLSLAIGKKGQNVRLASKLTGWQIDIRSESQKIPLSAIEGVNREIESKLSAGGIHTLKDILKSTPEELAHIEGITPELAETLVRGAHQVILNKDGKAKPKDEEAVQSSGDDKTDAGT